MLYLWIFGDNVELALGRVRFVGFYLLGGVLAALIQVLSGPAAQVPMVGASGAIAAVLGAYLALYPKNRVLVLVWLIFIVTTVRVPAIFSVWDSGSFCRCWAPVGRVWPGWPTSAGLSAACSWCAFSCPRPRPGSGHRIRCCIRLRQSLRRPYPPGQIKAAMPRIPGLVDSLGAFLHQFGPFWPRCIFPPPPGSPVRPNAEKQPRVKPRGDKWTNRYLADETSGRMHGSKEFGPWPP